MRAKAFQCLLRQEIAYFDRTENTSGAICARLSSDALAVQQMTGARLGMIFEMLAMLICATAFGFWFSWQLTLILLVIFVILFALLSIDVRAKGNLSHDIDLTTSQASSVRVDYSVSLSTS